MIASKDTGSSMTYKIGDVHTFVTLQGVCNFLCNLPEALDFHYQPWQYGGYRLTVIGRSKPDGHEISPVVQPDIDWVRDNPSALHNQISAIAD
jgi:hypothetical protein